MGAGFRPVTLVELPSVEGNLVEKLLAWKTTWVAAGRPDHLASARCQFDYGTVDEIRRPQRPRPSPAEKDGIILLYRDQVPVKEIAERFQMNRRTIWEMARRSGLEPHPRGLSAAHVEQAIGRYQAGASLATIGKELEFDANTVMAALKRRGVPMRPRRGGRRAVQ